MGKSRWWKHRKNTKLRVCLLHPMKQTDNPFLFELVSGVLFPQYSTGRLHFVNWTIYVNCAVQNKFQVREAYNNNLLLTSSPRNCANLRMIIVEWHRVYKTMVLWAKKYLFFCLIVERADMKLKEQNSFQKLFPSLPSEWKESTMVEWR